jgi:hypothetical protein
MSGNQHIRGSVGDLVALVALPTSVASYPDGADPAEDVRTFPASPE